jgi:hypothetical protein
MMERIKGMADMIGNFDADFRESELPTAAEPVPNITSLQQTKYTIERLREMAMVLTLRAEDLQRRSTIGAQRHSAHPLSPDALDPHIRGT